MHIAVQLFTVFYCCVTLPASEGARCAKMNLPAHLLRERTGNSAVRRMIGAEFQFSCPPPYVLKGPKKAMCVERRGKAIWYPSIPKCKCATCALTNDYFVTASNKRKACVEENVKFSCKVGKAFRGDAVRKCKSDGSFSGQPLECAPCCHKPNAPNALAKQKGFLKRLCEYDKVLYGNNSEVELICKDGYEAENDGPFRLSCRGFSGSWKGSTPNCRPRDGCFRPSNLTNAHVVGEKKFYGIGEIIYYECARGFSLKGQSALKCLPENKWNGHSPHCNRIQCPKLQSPDNNLISSISIDEIRFTCRQGYDLIGPDRLACMPNGKWSGSVPKCIKNCGGCKVPKTLKLPSSRSCFVFNHMLSDLSVDGFYLRNFQDCSVTCLKSRSSEGELAFGAKNPRLWIDMRQEYEVSGVNVYGVNEIGEDAIARFDLNSLQNLPHSGDITSNEGFEVHVSLSWHSPVRRQDDMQRSKATLCGRQNDTLSKNTTEYGVCCANYIRGRYLTIYIPGNNKILSVCEVDIFVKPYSDKCMRNKLLNTNTQYTAVTHCPDPGFIRNGQRIPQSFKQFAIGESVGFTCHDCYELRGNRTMTCGKNGTWEKTDFPYCRRKLAQPEC